MSYRLVILGILAEQPYYGYELKQTIERQHFADYIRLSGGGLYYHLRKLRDEGYIEEQMVEREGNYPDRHIYRITKPGRAYLLDLLRTTLSDAAGRRSYDPIDAALAFAFLLPREEVLARLQHQLDAMHSLLAVAYVTQRVHQRLIEHTASRPASFEKSESLYAQLMLDRNVALLEQEVRWLQEARERIAANSDFAVGEIASHDPAFKDEYSPFEQKLGKAAEVTTSYSRQLQQAWNEYEESLKANGGGEAARAFASYQRRIAEARQAYEAKTRQLELSEEDS
ncbi:PadR family transcriptional regulator [Ktedonosporobacter rubrisoli]|nr:PadR family transcriptional regulator [Ktedonosporobacter rubrisoli]